MDTHNKNGCLQQQPKKEPTVFILIEFKVAPSVAPLTCVKGLSVNGDTLSHAHCAFDCHCVDRPNFNLKIIYYYN